MPDGVRLEGLRIDEASGVDYPANLSDGWLVMKAAPPPPPTRKEGGMPPELVNRDALPDDAKAFLADVEAKLKAAEDAKVAAEEALAKAKGDADPEPIDKSKLDPTVRKALEDAEAAVKAANDARAAEVAKAAAMEERVQKMEDDRRLTEFVTKAATEFGNLGKPSDVGALLVQASARLDEATYTGLTTLLKAANAQLDGSKLLETFGDPNAADADKSFGDRLTAKAQELVTAGTCDTIEIAKAKVMRDDPSFRREYAETRR